MNRISQTDHSVDLWAHVHHLMVTAMLCVPMFLMKKLSQKHNLGAHL